MFRTMKTPSLSVLVIAALTAFALGQQEVSSKVEFRSVALVVRMIEKFGAWQEVEFAYEGFKNLSEDVISVETPDVGGGLFGAVVMLEYPDSKRSIWGQE